MPVKIACPKCSKKYTLPDSAVGKAVKCKACETTFRTKMPGAAAPASAQPANPAAQPSQPARPKPAQQRPTQSKPAQPARPNLNEFGIDGGFQQQADIFGMPPQAAGGLDNFAEEDVFGESVDPIVLGPAGAAAAAPENPFQSVLTNSSMRGSSARNKARKKKQSKAGADLSAYGVVRIGMMCVGGAGAATLFASFLSFAMSLLIRLIVGASGEVPQGLAVVAGIVSLLLLVLMLLSFVVSVVGQIMCMFAPQGNERLNSIASGALAFFASVGFVVISLAMGISVQNASEAGLLAANIGLLIGLVILGVMVIAATFLFINFYRKVGQNIRSDRLVQASNQAMIIAIVGFLMPFLTFGLLFLLGIAGLGAETTGIIAVSIFILNSIFAFVASAVTLKMVWTGVSSLKN